MFGGKHPARSTVANAIGEWSSPHGSRPPTDSPRDLWVGVTYFSWDCNTASWPPYVSGAHRLRLSGSEAPFGRIAPGEPSGRTATAHRHAPKF